ncbi:MAG: hypothetical protein QW343_04260 [Candidatus Norongarragalinales archaeon]
MKPVHHLLFGFAVTIGFFALFLPDCISWQVVFLALVSGFLPDFDHREWLWRLVAFAVFVGFFAFFANSLYANTNDAFLSALAAFATAAAVSWAIYAAHPFTRDIFDLSERKQQFAGAEGWFCALYVLIVFAVTLSPVLALAAFIGYSSHWVLDALAYQTRFGRRFLVNYPQPEKPMSWHIRRLQQEELAKRKAKPEKAGKRTERKNEKKKPSSAHGFFGAGVAGEHVERAEREQSLGEHSLASDKQLLEEPEEHREEARESQSGH